jgi:hypothetical protein
MIVVGLRHRATDRTSSCPLDSALMGWRRTAARPEAEADRTGNRGSWRRRPRPSRRQPRRLSSTTHLLSLEGGCGGDPALATTTDCQRRGSRRCPGSPPVRHR